MSLIGKTAEVRLGAVPLDAANNDTFVPDDGYPAVLVNSRLAALMELAAARLLRSQLEEGESSVSVEMDITHLVPTVQGELRAVATCLGNNGRMHHFRVHAFDETGLVASAEHTRAVVSPKSSGGRRRGDRRPMLLDV